MASAEAKTTARHLLRSLLRAASYLPDELARTYIHGHIIQRFRKASAITPTRLQDARNSLNTLQRATNGEINPLRSVLYMTYGRTGRRRRELVIALLRPESLPPSASLPFAEKADDDVGTQDDDFAASRPMLRAFLKSQKNNNSSGWPKLALMRHLEPQIPEENIWGRPLALKRQKNIKHRFWAKTLSRILPPLPEAEWDMLRDLATGVLPYKGSPPRRARAVSTVEITDEEPPSLLSLGYLKQPIGAAARHDEANPLKSMNRHHISRRFMRRIWASVWNVTPKMTYDAETKKWTVTWGDSTSAASQGLVGTAGKADLALFEGVDKLQEGPKRTSFRNQKGFAKPSATPAELPTKSGG